MVLFFVVSLVAAYTSRNLIFEQRTAVNQQSSTQAMEAAEAGIEWALTRLNMGRVTASCDASAVAADTPFRERYLAIDTATGAITARAATATCVWTGADWSCTCPDAGDALPANPVGAGPFPAFRVRFVTVSTTQPGVIRLESNGCTRLDAACLSFGGQGLGGEGRTIVRSLLALANALPRPPAAALTARGAVDVAQQLVNTDPASNGIAVQSRAPDADVVAPDVVTLPGSPAEQARLADDPSLPADADRFFSSFFNMWPATHAQQPAAIDLDCAVDDCSAGALRTLATLQPGRIVWIRGDVDLDSAGDIGSATSPVVWVVEGDLTVSAAVDLYGVVYVRTPPAPAAADWASSWSGSALIRGALVTERGVELTGTGTVVFDRAVIDRLRRTSGSFVRVPGGWRDY